MSTPSPASARLFTACANRDADSIDLLFKAGADPNMVHNEEDWIGRMDDGVAKTGYNVLHALAGFGTGRGASSGR